MPETQLFSSLVAGQHITCLPSEAAGGNASDDLVGNEGEGDRRILMKWYFAILGNTPVDTIFTSLFDLQRGIFAGYQCINMH